MAKWTPNPSIVEAVELVVKQMPPVEQEKQVATIGFSKKSRAYTIRELLEEYKRGSKIGRAFEAVLVTNTVSRLTRE